MCALDKRWPSQKVGQGRAGLSSELINPLQVLAEAQWGLCLLGGACSAHPTPSMPWSPVLAMSTLKARGVWMPEMPQALPLGSHPCFNLSRERPAARPSLNTAIPGIYFLTEGSRGPSATRQEQEEAAEQSRGTERWQKTAFLSH